MQQNENFAKQAEAERPEVVARVVHSNPVVLDHCGPLNANDELMTVAQHAASVARWAEMFNRVEQQRDAAQARVAEWRAGIARAIERASVFDDGSDGADAESARSVVAILSELLAAAPPAQAQHSVPDVLFDGAAVYAALDDRQRMFTSPENVSVVLDAVVRVVRAAAPTPSNSVPQAWLDVQAERRRQVTAEGWTPEHDDLYCAAELPRAAAAYILSGANDEAPAIWPFLAKWWKPRDARANYMRAGALILAEIERLDRAAAPGKEGV